MRSCFTCRYYEPTQDYKGFTCKYFRIYFTMANIIEACSTWAPRNDPIYEKCTLIDRYRYWKMRRRMTK